MKRTLSRQQFDEIIQTTNAVSVKDASKKDLDELYEMFVKLIQLLNE